MENDTQTFDEKKHRSWLRANKRRQKIQSILGIVFFCGIAALALGALDDASPEWKGAIFIIAAIVAAHWEMRNRIDVLIEQVNQLQEKLNKQRL